jgi:uncharacterized protein YcfJ
VKQIIVVAVGLIGMVALARSAAAQYAPSIAASPGAGKPFQLFQQDDYVCQQWANQQVGYSQQQAGNQAVGGAVAGAVGGALLGGLLGGGKGAAIGAGAGAVTGGAVGSANAANTQYYGQQRFDGLYQQCMIGRGDAIGYQSPPPPPPPGYQNNSGYGGPSDE